MKAPVYTLIHDGEGGWWYRGRSATVRALLAKCKVIPGERCLDYGAGYGAMFSLLSEYGPVDALEVSDSCLPSLSDRGYRTIFQNDTECFAAATRYHLIGMFDVLEHIEEDENFLRRIQSKILPGGILVCSVPAHPFLFNDYDRNAQHFRRYTKSELRKKFHDAGLTISTLSYWNASLFPIVALFRLLGIRTEDSLHPSPIIDYILGWIVSIEALILRFLSLPIGLSLIIVARTKEMTGQIIPTRLES